MNAAYYLDITRNKYSFYCKNDISLRFPAPLKPLIMRPGSNSKMVIEERKGKLFAGLDIYTGLLLLALVFVKHHKQRIIGL